MNTMIVAVDTNCILPGRVGGLERYTLNLVRALRDGAPWVQRVVLLTRPENQDLFPRFAGQRCRVALVPRRLSNWNESSSEAESALREHQAAKTRLIHEARADVVHFPGNTINPIDLDAPAIVNLHDLQHRHLPHHFTSTELDRRERWWIASAVRAEAVIASTRFVAEDLVREVGVPQERIFVAHPPVDPDFHAAGAADDQSMLHNRGIVMPFFLYPAARWPHKNHNRLIKAFLSAGIPGAQLVLTGFDAPESFSASGLVRFLGRVDQRTLAALYRAATALVFPSEYEASSFPIMEAMACGCPVAASRIPCLAELVGDAGLLFDPHNDDEISGAMQRLALDAPLRAELSRRGAERVQRYTPERYLDVLHRSYLHAVASHRNREVARAA